MTIANSTDPNEMSPNVFGLCSVVLICFEEMLSVRSALEDAFSRVRVIG